MYQLSTPELRAVMHWLEKQFDPDQLRSAEVVTKNAVRITDNAGDRALAICRQDGSVELVPCWEEAC